MKIGMKPTDKECARENSLTAHQPAICEEVCCMNLFGRKYKVDYCGKKLAYQNAKDKYRAGKKVTLYCCMIATDTDYSFWLEGAPLSWDYDAQKGFVLRFTMPAHDVTIHCSSRNTMLPEMP